MRKFIETTGRSEEDAIAAALFQLGLERDDVSVEVVERAKSGFLGFGSSPAKVRVSYEEENGVPKAKTSHTLNPVPCYIYDNFYSDKYECIDGKYGLANVAATMVTMMGYDAPEIWEKSMIKLK